MDTPTTRSDIPLKPRVLIAEDDDITRLLLQRWLQSWGYEVTVARDGLEAWDLLERLPSLKLAIVDWMMPGIDGIELCRRLRAQAEYYRYILMITARTDMRHIVHALESGADDCIAKPFYEHEFRARISVATRILALQDELIEAREQLRLQSMKDPLTGLWNRSAFQDLFELELARAARSRSFTGLLLLDLDHFKEINDTHGHLNGDAVLRHVARLLKHNIRSYDIVGRYGGEEFLVGFPNSGPEQLCRHAERLRIALATAAVPISDALVPVTLSVGAVVASPDQRTLHEVMAVADIALYRAKQAGRNRSVYCRQNSPALACIGKPQESCVNCNFLSSEECTVPPASPER